MMETVKLVKKPGRARRRVRKPLSHHEYSPKSERPVAKTPVEMTDAELVTRRSALRAEIVMPPDAVERTIAIYERIILANR